MLLLKGEASTVPLKVMRVPGGTLLKPMVHESSACKPVGRVRLDSWENTLEHDRKSAGEL